MRWLFSLVVCACMALAGVNPQLLQVHSVYILPMGSGMDQFLANRMARLGMMRVVADPQQADAIFTDRIGELFEKKLNELYPPDTDEDDDSDTGSKGAMKGDVEQQRSAGFGRGHGNFFLVDRKTRNVLWSVYERPKNTSADELNKTAERIVNRLKHDTAAPSGN